MLPVLLCGYIFLLIFRPFEYWTWLGDMHLERVYMIFFMIAVALSPKKRMLATPINGLVLFFLLTLVVSGLFAYRWDSAQNLIVEYLKSVVLYFMIVITVRNEDDFKKVMLAFLFVMFVYVGKSAWEFFVNGRFEYTMGIRRMGGVDKTYGAPNSFAATIAYSLPFLWAIIRWKPDRKWFRYALWAYGLLAIVAVIYTGSRSGMMTVLLFLLLVLFRSSRKVLAVLFLAFGLMFAWYNMPDSLQIRFLSIFVKGLAPASADQSADGRMEGLKQGFKVFKKHPALGIGPANFQHSWPGTEWGYNAHTLYGQIIGELGIAGVCAFGLLVFALYSINRKVIRVAKRLYHCVDSEDDDPGKADELPGSSGFNGNAGHGEALSVETGNTSDTALEVSSSVRRIQLYQYMSEAVIQTILLLMFKGIGDHNLYRYTWLWLAAITVLNYHFLKEFSKEHACA